MPFLRHKFVKKENTIFINMDAIQVLHNNRKANVIKDHARLRLVPNIKGIVASMVRVLCNVSKGCRRLLCISVTFLSTFFLSNLILLLCFNVCKPFFLF